MYMYTIEWPGENGSTRVYSGHRPTSEAALRAKVEKIRALSEKFPKRRSVQVRAA